MDRVNRNPFTRWMRSISVAKIDSNVYRVAALVRTACDPHVFTTIFAYFCDDSIHRLGAGTVANANATTIPAAIFTALARHAKQLFEELQTILLASALWQERHRATPPVPLAQLYEVRVWLDL